MANYNKGMWGEKKTWRGFENAGEKRGLSPTYQ